MTSDYVDAVLFQLRWEAIEDLVRIHDGGL